MRDAREGKFTEDNKPVTCYAPYEGCYRSDTIWPSCGHRRGCILLSRDGGDVQGKVTVWRGAMHEAPPGMQRHGKTVSVL